MTQPADKPHETPTKELPKEEISVGLLNKLVGAVNDMKDSFGARFDRVEASIDSLMESDKTKTERLLRAEKRQDDFEEWRARASERAKAPSAVDVSIQAELAKYETAREELSKKVDAQGKDLAELKSETKAQTALLNTIANGAKRISEHPLTKLVVLVATIIATTWLARHGIKVEVPQ